MKYNIILLLLALLVVVEVVNSQISIGFPFTISNKQITDKPIAIAYRGGRDVVIPYAGYNRFTINEQYSAYQPIGKNSDYATYYKSTNYLDHPLVVLNETCQIIQRHFGLDSFYLQCKDYYDFDDGKISIGTNLKQIPNVSSMLSYDDKLNILMGMNGQKLNVYNISYNNWIAYSLGSIYSDPSVPFIPTYYDLVEQKYYTFGESSPHNVTIVIFDLKNLQRITRTIIFANITQVQPMGVTGHNGIVYIACNINGVGTLYSYDRTKNETSVLTKLNKIAFPMVTGYNSRYVGFISSRGVDFQLFDLETHILETQANINLIKYISSTTLDPQYFFTLTSIIPTLHLSNIEYPPTPTPISDSQPSSSNNQKSLIGFSLVLLLLSMLFVI